MVDDSVTMRRQLRLLLSSDGYSVVEAENGEQGLRQAIECPVELMLVDINMPVMDGIEMIKAVRQVERHKNTPIFILTTESAVSKAQEGKQAGANAWMVKPFQPPLLLKAVGKTFEVC